MGVALELVIRSLGSTFAARASDRLLHVLRAGAVRRAQSCPQRRRPKVDYESRTLGLDRNELGVFLVQAGLGSPRDHALASLLALNGLRICDALGAEIDDLDFERGHRTLKIVRKGGKHVTIPGSPDLAGNGPVHRREDDGTDLPRRQGGKDGPLRCRSHRQAARPAGRDRQADQPARPAALVHHLGP